MLEIKSYIDVGLEYGFEIEHVNGDDNNGSKKIDFYKDTHMVKIFESLIDSPKTAQQISEHCNIPKSTVYRKLRKLEEVQAILRKGIIENGVRNRIYIQSKIERQVL